MQSLGEDSEEEREDDKEIFKTALCRRERLHRTRERKIGEGEDARLDHNTNRASA